MSNEERLKVLEMVQSGEISPEEALRLIEALGGGATAQGDLPDPLSPEPEESAEPETRRRRKPRWLHIRVTDTDADVRRVNLTLPVALVKAGLKMGAHFGPEIDGLDWYDIGELFNGDIMGHIVDVVDDDDGEHVEIFLD